MQKVLDWWKGRREEERESEREAPLKYWLINVLCCLADMVSIVWGKQAICSTVDSNTVHLYTLHFYGIQNHAEHDPV
jgi:hypothetical protein